MAALAREIREGARIAMPEQLFTDTDCVIREWAERELACWDRYDLDPQEAEARIRRLAMQDGSICLYRIEEGAVSFDEAVVAAWPDLAVRTTPMGYRAANYLDHLRDAFAIFGMSGSGVIGVYLNDLYPGGIPAPLFCFQKRSASRGILLPDVDFLSWKYYFDEQNRYVDETSFADKLDKAIFVGSTTGDIVLTADHVVNLSNARLRSAVHFRNRENVVFHLPHVVQCDDRQTEALIEGLNVAGRRWSWREQLNFRYLISLDGNGATCSRVALGLSSNSAIIKYDSPYRLYYFHGLEPWEHYVPVMNDADVDALLADSLRLAAMGGGIAERSRKFSNRFLSRLSVLRYSAEVCSLYLAKFGSPSQRLRERVDDHLLDVFAHVAHHGSVWGRPGEWLGEASGGTEVEGVCITPAEQIPGTDLSYAIIDREGRRHSAHGGTFCGTYSMGLPVHGLSINFSGASARTFKLRCRLRFADGFEADASSDGAPVRRSAPLTDIRLDVGQRGAQAAWRRYTPRWLGLGQLRTGRRLRKD